MNTDGNIDGTLSFGTAIDMSGFESGQNSILERISELGKKAEQQGMKLQEFFNDIPSIDLSKIADINSLEQIADAFSNIDYVVGANKEALKALESEYQRLGSEMDNALQSGKDGEYIRLRDKQSAVKELIALRKKLISTTGAVAEELSEYEAKLQKAANSVKAESNEEKKSESAHTSLRQRLRELKEELVEMEAAGQRNTQRYREIQDEAARLTDAWADATHQATILAHDQRGMQGVISGLSGLSGGFMAASSAVSLFSGENEDLQKVMNRVQQLMGITMGLQQLQATLDKDSAFRLVTLNGLKEWWNKLLAIGAGEATGEAAAITLNAEAVAAETVAEETNAVAKTANIAATEAETVADMAQSAASVEAAGADAIQTGAIVAETGAATAGTAANIGLAGAFRMVGAAIKSVPVFGWIIAAISALIAVVSKLTRTEKEDTAAIEENKEKIKQQIESYNARERVMKEAASLSAKEKSQVEILSAVIHDNTSKLEDRKKAIQELKRIIPEYNALLSDEGVLTDENTKSIDDYIDALDRLAMAKALQNELEKLSQKDVENQIRQRRAQRHVEENSDYYDPQKYADSMWGASTAEEVEALQQKQMDEWVKMLDAMVDGTDAHTKEAMEAAQQDLKDAKKEAEEIASDKKDLLEMMQEMGLQGLVISTDDKAEPSSDGIKKSIDDYNRSVFEFIRKSDEELSEQIIASKEDGLEKELDASRHATEKRLADWEEQLRTLARQRKEILKAKYMSNEGATEIGWENSLAGKKTEDDYMNDILAEGGEIAERWNAVRAQIVKNGEIEILAIEKEYWDNMIERYGDYRQRRIAIIERYNKEEEMLYKEGTVIKDENGNITGGELKDGMTKGNVDELRRQRDEAVAAVDEEIASRSGSYQRWLNEISSMTVKQLRQLLSTAKKALEQLKKDPNADPEKLAEAEAQVKQLESAIEKASLSPEEEDIEQWRLYASELDEVGNAIKSLGEDMDGMAGEAFAMFGSIMQSTSKFIQGIADVAEKSMKAMESTADTASKAIAAAQSSVAILAIIQAIYSAVVQLRDFIDNNFDTDSGFGQFASDFLHFLTDSETMLENLAWSLLGPVGTLIGVLTSNNTNSDRQKHIKEIERLTKEYENVNRQLEEMERQANETFGESNAAIRQQQIELKELQIEYLEAAIAEEEALKNPDNDKIDEWKEQIADLRNDILDLGEDAEDAIFGEGLKTAIENFGDALVEAWESGKSASEAANDYMRKMIKQTVLQAILDYTQASAKIEAIRQKLKEYLENDGIISEDERLDLERMAQELMDEVGNEFEWAQGLFDGEREGSQRGIATASQDSVDENNARLTTIQGHTYSIVQGLDELNLTANEILAKVTGIEANTSETNSKLDNMNSRVRNIESTVDEIQRNGIKLKS